MQDLQAFGEMQRTAAESGGPGLTWAKFEARTTEQLRKLEDELPLATAEAAQLQVCTPNKPSD